MRAILSSVFVVLTAGHAAADANSAFATAQSAIADNQPTMLFQDQTLEQIDGCTVALTVEDVSGSVLGQAFFRFDADMSKLAPQDAQRADMGDIGIMILVPTADGTPSVTETNTFIGSDAANTEAVLGMGGMCDGATCSLELPSPFMRVAATGDDANAKADTIIDALTALSAACQ